MSRVKSTWVMLAPVEAEKAMFLGMYLSGMLYPSFSLMTTDLPVPVAPEFTKSLYTHRKRGLGHEKMRESSPIIR